VKERVHECGRMGFSKIPVPTSVSKYEKFRKLEREKEREGVEV